MRDLRATLLRRRRWYAAPVRLWRAVWAATLMTVALGQVPAAAAPLPLSPTACVGSWDGPGMTACELLGAPGIVGDVALDWGAYVLSPTPLYEITAYHAGNTLRIDQLGQLVYEREPGGKMFATLLHPTHFAVWQRGAFRIVGIEDLEDADPTGSDWDYQDYVVELTLTGVPTQTRSIPEPSPVPLVLLALVGIADRMWRRTRRER